MSQDHFFPPIGQLAKKADDLPEEPTTSDGDIQDDRPLEEIESLCMRCGEQGTTRIMLTSIPYFRQVIVMSFRCEHCGATNNEIQTAGAIRELGVTYTLKVLHRGDLDRQIVRSQACEIAIPEFDLTLPANERGQLTTVEGLLRDIVADLTADQPLRRTQDEAAYTKIQEIVDGLKEVIDDDEEDEEVVEPDKPVVEKLKDDPVKKTITITLDDPSGDSFLEFVGSMADPKWSLKTYTRTLEQAAGLGLVVSEEETKGTVEENAGDQKGAEGEDKGLDGRNDEIFEFPGICPRCGRALVTRMKKVSIPYFKDTLIMSTNCENCGYRDNEVKAGSAISEKGKRITLKVIDQEDLGRDVLKSETGGLMIPEIDLVLQHGTLGGRFTTLEGILNQVYEELSQKIILTGDSSTTGDEDREKFQKFLEDLNAVESFVNINVFHVIFTPYAQIKQVEREFTLIIDDPMANSYVQNIYAPDPDPNMTVETYERSWEQNEELGLNDMRVESYSGDKPVEGNNS
ncbi:zf-ZPR1-domain-containing protein [Boletus reticuloceps]|uniref:Zf-ZPR1-domain-containing protein n=1 Tax=Boletus reticuloceps TaxID=495285 RepID=A0A8I3AGF8_9AGAM|nr:zf-ZPR1-domain-containing protein [Boletus reticuloceps]